jgi:L-fuconolactonase
MFLHCLETAAQTPVVIEHLGGLGKFNPDNPERECLVDHVLRFARYPHTYMKLTGLGELRQRAMPVNHAHPFVPTADNLLDRVIAAFGPQRLMWGSDYPPVSAREGYGNALNWLRDQLTMLSKNTQQAIFAETAQRVFPLRS